MTTDMEVRQYRHILGSTTIGLVENKVKAVLKKNLYFVT